MDEGGDLVELELGNQDSVKNVHHAIIGGMIGSGKGNLLRVWVTQLLCRYRPEELELYLLDFRHGGDLVNYIKHRLPHVRAVVAETAAARNSRLLLLGRDFGFDLHDSGMKGLRLTVRGLAGTYEDLRFPLLGAHQADNLACAVAAVECVAERGLPVTAADIRAGSAGVRWPGRLEVVSENPPVVLDGAHNPDAIEALATALRTLFTYRRMVAVVGALGDKAAQAMFSSLLPLVDELIVTTPAFAARAMPAERLAETIATACPSLAVRVIPQIREALAVGLGLVGPGDLLLVTGSFYLVGDARTHLRELTRRG